MSSMTQTDVLRVETGDEFTRNVKPLLHEIRHALDALLDGGGRSVIDLRSMPLAPGEEEHLLEELGQGEICPPARTRSHRDC